MALIDDLLRQTRERRQEAGEETPDFFADFNGIPGAWTGPSSTSMTRTPYGALRTTLKAEIDEAAWATLHSDTSLPFARPNSGRVAVKVINHLGDEVMKVFRIT